MKRRRTSSSDLLRGGINLIYCFSFIYGERKAVADYVRGVKNNNGRAGGSDVFRWSPEFRCLYSESRWEVVRCGLRCRIVGYISIIHFGFDGVATICLSTTLYRIMTVFKSLIAILQTIVILPRSFAVKDEKSFEKSIKRMIEEID